MAVIPGQKVKVKWINKNRKHYEDKGYVFTKWFDEFEINVEDLSDGSNANVIFSCDYEECDKIFERKYSNYMKTKHSFCSKSCANNPNIRIIHTVESLVNDFWRFYREHKKYPLTYDFRGNADLPNYNVVTRRFGSWLNYLKEVGVVDSENSDGWYIHDEAVLRKYYPSNMINEIQDKLMIKRTENTIREKANRMGLFVVHDVRYIPKYHNTEIKNKLINEANLFYKNNGRSPYLYELKSVENSKNAIAQNWTSYNDFLKHCNLPIFRRTVKLKTKEDGILFLINLRHLLGRNPRITELDKYGLNKGWFKKRFGSYKAALYEAKLINDEDFDEQIKLDNSLEGIKKLFKILNRVPGFTEYKEYASNNNLFYPTTLASKCGVSSYVDLCREVLGESNRILYDKQELISNLLELKEKLDRVPMGKDLVENGYPSISVYKTFFNKRYFNDIIRDLGWEPYGQDSYYKSDDEMLDDYLSLYQKLDRVPLRDDIDDEDNICHSATYINRFGSLGNVCELLDLNYNELVIDSKMGSGTTCFDKNGDFCRSIAEMKITNMLIDLDIYFIKEFPYNKITKKKDRRRFDWYLPDYDVYIEYFGLYDRSRKESNCRIGEYARKADKKVNDCQKLGKTLIHLYPRDYKKQFKRLKEKLVLMILFQKVV